MVIVPGVGETKSSLKVILKSSALRVYYLYLIGGFAMSGSGEAAERQLIRSGYQLQLPRCARGEKVPWAVESL